MNESMMAGAIAAAIRREEFSANAKPCPKCNAKQVQLKGWGDKALWKCRKCKHQWTSL